MRIAITGATGFVGSNLTTRLVSEEHEIVRLARRARSGDADIVVSRFDDVNQLREAFAGCAAAIRPGSNTPLHYRPNPQRPPRVRPILCRRPASMFLAPKRHRRHIN